MTVQGLKSGASAPNMVVTGRAGLPRDIHVQVTFASGVATVAWSNYSGVTCVRQGSTGIYDLVVPKSTRLQPISAVISDTNDDTAGTAVSGRFGVISASAGEVEVVFYEAEADLDDIAPADTATAYINLRAFG